MPHDIFISYAREDRDRVRRIAEELARRGLDVWWDPRLRGGQDYRDAIESALKAARCVVVAWSRHSVDSDFVIDEAERGKQRGILLPVFLDEGISPPLGFGGTHAKDLSGWLADPSRQDQFDQFAEDLDDLLGRAPGVDAPAPGTASPGPGLRTVPTHGVPERWPSPPGGRLGSRQRTMLGVAGVLVLVAAGGIVYAMMPGVDPSPPPAGRDSVRVAGDAASRDTAPTAVASTDTLPVLSGPRTGMLVGLRCALPGESRNPIGERAEQVTPPEYQVDTRRHLLLHANGQRVRVVQAASVGDTLLSRRLIVAHHTALPARPAEAFFEEGTLNASAHLLIHRDGSVTQLVPFDIAAYHAGASQWKEVRGLNRHSIGIEMENLGMLTQQGGSWYFSGGSRPVPADSVERFDGETGGVRGWHGYTDAQLRAFFQVSCALRRAYPTIEDLVGHQDISPGRKIDPGPAFPMDAMRRRLFPGRRE